MVTQHVSNISGDLRQWDVVQQRRTLYINLVMLSPKLEIANAIGLVYMLWSLRTIRETSKESYMSPVHKFENICRHVVNA